MCGPHEPWKTIRRIYVDGSHQVESQKSEVGQVVLRQLFPLQMSVKAAKPIESLV